MPGEAGDTKEKRGRERVDGPEVWPMCRKLQRLELLLEGWFLGKDSEKERKEESEGDAEGGLLQT